MTYLWHGRNPDMNGAPKGLLTGHTTISGLLAKRSFRCLFSADGRCISAWYHISAPLSTTGRSNS